MSLLPKRRLLISLGLIALFLPLVVYAQAPIVDQNLGVTTADPNFTTVQGLRPSQYLTTILNFLLGLAGVASFVYLLWGGIQWATAGGDKEAIEKARRKIVAAFIGAVVVFAAYGILFAARTLFHVNLIETRVDQLGTPGMGNGTGYGGPGGGYTDPAQPGAGTCRGCIDGGCGILNTTYIGPGDDPAVYTPAYASPCYVCTSTNWVRTGANCASLGGVACGTCPPL